MTNRTLQVTKICSLNCRHAALLVDTATQFPCSTSIGDGSHQFNAKSLLALLTLDIYRGSKLTITADGPQEEEACNAICSFFA